MASKQKQVLVYDISQLPSGKTIEDIKKEYDETGVVAWDSSISTNKYSPNVVTVYVTE